MHQVSVIVMENEEDDLSSGLSASFVELQIEIDRITWDEVKCFGNDYLKWKILQRKSLGALWLRNYIRYV
ncbi:hypothetical protein L6452_03877 [Arctium lappa]|uniref:Uncharacterized protein n=1 Tax=Arctium lappa TaxID=4217 RepID=A0ACB9FPD2_ARCLA|nr:hypothetical protein L6452_03877 [Arctium lappa]